MKGSETGVAGICRVLKNNGDNERGDAHDRGDGTEHRGTDQKEPDHQEEDREELLGLLATLKSEVIILSRTHPEEAESITGFAQVSTHEATRAEKNKALLNVSVRGLTSSIDGFETSHPELVRIVNRIALMLSNLGI